MIAPLADCSGWSKQLIKSSNVEKSNSTSASASNRMPDKLQSILELPDELNRTDGLANGLSGTSGDKSKL